MGYNSPMEEFVGSWWHPDNPKRTIGGVLKIDDTGRSELRLTDRLFMERKVGPGVNHEEFPVSVGPEMRPPVLHGKSKGRFITLLDSLSIRDGSVSGIDCTNDDQTVSPDVVIVGIHLESSDLRMFDGIRVEIENLTSWANMSGLESVYGDDVFSFRSRSVNSMVATSGEYELRLIQIRSKAGRPRIRLDGMVANIEEKVRLDVRREDLVTWNDFNEPVRKMQDLLTFASRHPCAVLSRALLKGVGAEEKMYRMYVREFVPPSAAVESGNDLFLFRMSDSSFGEIIAKWDDLVTRAGIGVNVLFGLDYQIDQYNENQIFSAASAVESIHRGLYPNSVALDAGEYESLLGDLKSSLSKEQYGWAKVRLRNDMGYKDRVMQIAKIPDSKAVEKLIGNVDQWAKWLRDSRNSIAHLDLSDLDRIPDDARYHLSYVTAALLHVAFMRELGFNAEMQCRAVDFIYWYRSGVFRTACIAAAHEARSRDKSLDS